jgi:pimeloyl-ACP methyl ester carboxylesterase
MGKHTPFFMKPILIYIHGYGSSGNSDTARNLRELLENDFNVITPTYNGSNPIEAAMTLNAAVETAGADKAVIAGTSLGGFFANYLARKHNRPAVIVNPALTPSQALAGFHKSQPILDAYVRLEAEERAFTAMPPRQVVVGVNDDTVNPMENGMKMEGVADVTAITMGHRVEPAFYGLIVQLIRKMAEKA